MAGLVELTIGGLMPTETTEIATGKAITVLKAFHDCGCNIKNPYMLLSLLALVVMPELRRTDKGLVDGMNFTFLPVVEGPAQ